MDKSGTRHDALNHPGQFFERFYRLDAR